ncbi:MAG: DUF885 domain-containing protein [Actinomycetota bacterium]|nr:DUF885 domain-containing protein [Actinomycetota bacterium]
MTDADPTLVSLGERYLRLRLSASPFGATLLGIPGYADLVPDSSDEAARDLARDLRQIAAQAAALDGLDADHEVTRAVLVSQCTDEADEADLRTVTFQTAPFWASPHSQLLSMVPKVQLVDAEGAQAYLDRLERVPGFLDGAGEQLRRGTAAGRTAAARSLLGSIAALDAVLASPLSEDVLLAPSWSDAAWQLERERLVRDAVRPALARLRDLYRDVLLPAARPDAQVGIGWLPGGAEAYAVLARASTTTQLSPTALHELGLRELDRLEGEYAQLGKTLFGTSDVDDVLHRMRTDPALRLRDADDLLDRSRRAIEAAEAVLPTWFGRLPSSACQLRLVPPGEAVNAAPAYYLAPDPASGRPGVYWVNAHEVAQRPVYDVEAIAFHEAVPGHHLQISISKELDSLPLFRRVNISGAFTEGWALYAERLADEMGLYSSELDRLGMLSCDSWRACRLVVDTGMHALGWSFAEAVDFMARRTALPLSVIEPEVDRYVGLPGQALSYMVGRLEIVRMREQAQSALGARMDVRSFHDVVLGGGALPLTVLDGQVQAWVADRSRI